MSRERKASEVQVVLSMHPSRVQELASWLHDRVRSDESRLADIVDQLRAQEHGRRLAVIDPEDRAQAERLTNAFAKAMPKFVVGLHPDDTTRLNDVHVRAMQAALIDFADPTRRTMADRATVANMLMQVAADREIGYWAEGHPDILEAVEVYLQSLADHLGGDHG